MAISLKTTSGKILASVALVGTAAAVAGMGTYGAFTSSTSASQAVTAGTVTIALGAPGPANTLNVPVAGLLPGRTEKENARVQVRHHLVRKRRQDPRARYRAVGQRQDH